jgi:hypothetical protein
MTDERGEGSMTRAKIAPDAAAASLAQLPSRLVKKLDADPKLADRWTWRDDGTIATDKGEIVTLGLEAGVVTGVSCSCLLSPKCLHVAAVVTVLEPAPSRVGSVDAQTSSAVGPVSTVTSTMTPPPPTRDGDTLATIAIAEHAFRACADVLATGAEATGTFAQAELLRAIHGCRAAGLHRLAAAQTRALRSIRELRGDRPEFQLAVLAADLREALVVAHALARGDATPANVGRARRDYESVGNLRLYGVFTEAIVGRSGYAGAVTYLVDERGALYTRADVAPGEVTRAAAAYDAPAGIGDAVLPHRELARAGLFVSGATASADGRLGAGAAVRAVRASEPSRWEHPAIAQHWQRSLPEQMLVLANHEPSTDDLRPAGWDLVFVEGALAVIDNALALALDHQFVWLHTAHDHRALVARDNFAVLARAAGIRVRVIARARLNAPRRLELLAIAPAPGETRLVLPDAWHGRANVHYDRLAVPSPGQVMDTPTQSRIADASANALLEPLRRRVERVVLGGLATLPVHALAEIEHEAITLGERALRGAGEVLRDLVAIASNAQRAMTGARRAVDRPTFARAWLRAALYEDAARRRIALAAW